DVDVERRVGRELGAPAGADAAQAHRAPELVEEQGPRRMQRPARRQIDRAARRLGQRAVVAAATPGEERDDRDTPCIPLARRPHQVPQTLAGAAAAPSRSRIAPPSSRASQRAPRSIFAPGRQPSSTVIAPPETSNTRPVTPRASTLASHATSGATFSGAI